MGRTNIEHNYEPTDPSEWSEEAKKNMFELSQTLSDMEEADKKRTPEERELNKIGGYTDDGKFVYF